MIESPQNQSFSRDSTRSTSLVPLSGRGSSSPRRQSIPLHIRRNMMSYLRYADDDRSGPPLTPPLSRAPTPAPAPTPKSVLTEASPSAQNSPQKPVRRPALSIPPSDNPAPGPPPRSKSASALIEARTDMHKVLANCRQFFIACELTRMRKARVGKETFYHFLRENYVDGLANCIIRKIDERVPDVSTLFYQTVNKLVTLTREHDRRVETARSADEVQDLLDEMCDQADSYCQFRRLRVLDIFESLRLDFESATIEISDAAHDDLKRDVFGLKPDGNYDFSEEREPLPDLDGADYLPQQPDLNARVGFSERFQSALDVYAHASGALRAEDIADNSEFRGVGYTSSNESDPEWMVSHN